MPWPLYSWGNSPQCLLDRRLGGPQNWFGYGGEEKNFPPLPDMEPQLSSL